MFKPDFPLIQNHPEICYLDNAATTQKPSMVIDGVSDFVKNEYANIHRGLYPLSDLSEAHYQNSKELVAELFNCCYKEVIYTANATASFNLLAQTLIHSKFLKQGDTVLLGITEHHASILPWMNLAQDFGFKIQFFNIDQEEGIDFDDFKKKYTNSVKVVSCSIVSNVTGAILEVEKIKQYLNDDTFFILDASQAAPNMVLDFQELGCNALVFTAHKMMAYTGLGVLIMQYPLIKTLEPMSLGGGTVRDVDFDHYELKKGTSKFESGTPNIIGAISLEYALKYIQTIGNGDLKKGMKKIESHEKELAKYTLKKFESFGEKINLIGPKHHERIALFSFTVPTQENFNLIGEFLAEKNICIRCGGHCAYPLHKAYNIGGTCRLSGYIYNDQKDIDLFFNALEELLEKN